MGIQTSPELFINMKSIPDKRSQEYEPFFQKELEKIEYGITINGVFIDPWLYWYTNHWHIFKNEPDKKNPKVIKRVFGNPDLRDNEWEFAEARAKAIEQKKGLLAIGIRRFGKSEIEASIIGRSATIFRGSENVVSGGNDKDIKLITDKLERGLGSLHPYFQFQRVEDDWKRQVTLGIKEKSGKRYIHSYILIRNYDDGNNSEAAAGITAKEFIIDEIGKFLFLRALEAAIPAFTSEFGWICSPLLVGTGGSFEKGSDAEKVFFDPEGHNMLGFTWKDEPKQIGFFVPNSYRLEAKVETNLGEWLKNEKGIYVPDNSELFKVPFKQSNAEKAEEVSKKNRERAKKANDQEAYLKEIMYYPENPMECFLTVGNAFYNGEAARHQKARLLSMGRVGSPVFLWEDGEGEIRHTFSDKSPVMNWPVKTTDDKDAPLMIYEFPMEAPPFGLYVAGVDPYRQDKSKYSKSLGAVYIFKRIHKVAGEGYQDMFVASYAARPEDIDKFNEQARLLIKFYNARTLCENDEMSFINYMIYKGDGHYLEDQPDWLREIVPNTTMERKKGIHRSAEGVRIHLRGLLKKYLDEKIGVKRNEKDEPIGDILGITRILDPMLCEEISKFNEDDNFDREVAASLAIALARHLDVQFIVASTELDPRLQAYFDRGKKRSSRPYSILDADKPSFIKQQSKGIISY